MECLMRRISSQRGYAYMKSDLFYGGYVLFMVDRTTRSLYMKKIIDASYLKSSILTQKYEEVNRSKPEVRWLPIKTRSECTVEGVDLLFLL